MSGLIHRRRLGRRLLVAAGVITVAVATAGSLAASLQVREILVLGTRRFPAADVTAALQHAVGTPTVVVRADDLRAAVLQIPWVAEAAVRVSLDGVVTCLVEEQEPVAVAADGPIPVLLDHRGRALGPSSGGDPWLQLVGFVGQSEDIARLLEQRGAMETAWGAPLVRADRLGSRDVRLVFGDSTLVVVADPTRPGDLGVARQVRAAWAADGRPLPAALDIRVPGRVGVRPAADPGPGLEGEV